MQLNDIPMPVPFGTENDAPAPKQDRIESLPGQKEFNLDDPDPSIMEDEEVDMAPPPADADVGEASDVPHMFDIPKMSRDDQSVITKINTKLQVMGEYALLGFRPNGPRTGGGDWLEGRWRDTTASCIVHLPSAHIHVDGYPIYTLFEFASKFCGFVSTSVARKAYKDKIDMVVAGTKTPQEAHLILFPDGAQDDRTAVTTLPSTGPVSDPVDPLEAIAQQANEDAPPLEENDPNIRDDDAVTLTMEMPDDTTQYVIDIRVANENSRKARRIRDMAIMAYDESVRVLHSVIDYDHAPQEARPTAEQMGELKDDIGLRPILEVTTEELGFSPGVVNTFAKSSVLCVRDLLNIAGPNMDEWKLLTKLNGVGEGKAQVAYDAYHALLQKRQSEIE